MIIGRKRKETGGSGTDGENFTGLWHSTFGPLRITASGDTLHGEYRFGPVVGELEGVKKGARLQFRYREPSVSGEGWFELIRPGRFAGKWRPDGAPYYFDWTGDRGFEGIWNSTFGPLKLALENDCRVAGFYETTGLSSIEGRAEGADMDFIYREPAAAGQGRFRLSDDGMGFEGEWLQDGQSSWQPWEGRRLLPSPGIIWLVVLESHWQRFLSEREYSFGGMLEEFFARLPRVQVRHRFFSGGEDLRRWARGLMFIPEPVALVIASHATEDGLNAGGVAIDADALTESLRYADSIILTHFSSCLMMGKGRQNGMATELHKLNRFPVSGYATTVNWAASAIIEFTLLNYIFEQGLPPEAAADEVLKALAFSGDTAPAGSPFPAAGLRMMKTDR